MDFQREFRKRALIARVLSRVWMLYGCAALQTCATYLAFGGLLLVLRSKCGEFVSRLEGLWLFGAPNAGKFSGVCCRFAVARAYKTWCILTLGLRV